MLFKNNLIRLAAVVVLLVYINRIQLVECINSVLDIKGTFPYLLNGTNGQIIEPRDYMDFENIYAPNSTYKREQTAQGRNYHMIKAFDFANYFKSDYWHYSNEQDLKLSAYPVANEKRCSQQLAWLERYLNDSKVLFRSGEEHVNLMTFVDSFGRPEASTYFGHGYWLGSYYECTRVSLDMAAFEREELLAKGINSSSYPSSVSTKIKTRYCVGKARDVDWPNFTQDNYQPRISYKVGLCLPESCETLTFGRHKDQLERLMRLNMPEYIKSRLYLDDLYCLPDARSPIRQLSLPSQLFLAACAIWLVLITTATWIHSCYKWHQKDLKKMTEQMRVDLVHQQALAASAAVAQQQAAATAAATGATQEKVANYIVQESIVHRQPVAKMVEQTNGIGKTVENQSSNQILQVLQGNHVHSSPLLLKTQPTSHLQQFKFEPKSRFIVEEGLVNHDDEMEDEHEQDDGHRVKLSKHSSSSSLSARLNDSHPTLIKILQCLSIKENMIEFQKKPALLRKPNAGKRLRINLNALDSIKCLCCILVIFGHIVFIHMQHLSNIIHTIEQSHQVAPRLLIAFFNFVDTFFIISGMLTAYFIFKRFNKKTFSNPLVWLSITFLRLIRLSPVYLLVFWFTKTVSVHLSEGPLWDYGTDRESIKGLCINDHWWKSLLYLGNLGTMQPLCILPAWSIIVDSQYSIILPPIIFLIFKHKRIGYLTLLIAIIVSTANMSHQLMTQTAVKTGDMAKVRLHVYPLISRFAAEFYNTAWNRIGPVAIGIAGGHALYLYELGVIKRWPWFMRGIAFKFILFMHLFIFILPTIGRYTDQPDQSASPEHENDITVFVLSNATVKPIWSLINTAFLLRIITDLRHSSQIARLMSHNIWHPLGKLCFASYLIHYEVILLLLKSKPDGLVNPTWWNAFREFSLAFLISTILAYLIHILYEAPINKLFMLNISTKQKQQQPSNEDNNVEVLYDDDDDDDDDDNQALRRNQQQQQQQQQQDEMNLTVSAGNQNYSGTRTSSKQSLSPSANFSPPTHGHRIACEQVGLTIH